MSILKITKEELKTKMDKKEDLVIIDVRADGAYNSSSKKIQGAVRITLNELEKDTIKIPEDNEIITYCT